MKKLFILLCYLFLSVSLSAQNEIDKTFQLFDYYCKQGLFTNASNLLVEKGNAYLDKGDTLTAYKLQLKNCQFTDEHLEEFLNSGLNWEGYFANWYVTISLEGWTKMKNEGAIHLFSVLRKMQKKAPHLLPFYASTLAYILDDFTDSIYCDSIYLLQYALDVIKSQIPTPQLVTQYIRIFTCFSRNRLYNSINGIHLVDNRLQEIKDWYLLNGSYIRNLNNEQYRNEIIEFETEYADILYLYASTISAQENDAAGAISLYKEEVSVITPLLQLDSRLSQKIAACQANISKEYYLLNDFVKSKEYNDSAILSLVNHKEDFEYCDILSAVALNYWNVNNKYLAAQYKLTEIFARERLGWKCSQSDWALYFMYVVNENPLEVLINKNNAISADTKYGENYGVYEYIGRAYSLLMDETNGYKDSAEFFFHKAERIVDSKYYDNKTNRHTAKSSIDENWASHYMRLGDYERAYYISKNNLLYNDNPSYINYCNVAILASLLHDTSGIHNYLPKYYYGMEEELGKMLPILGTIESDTYLGNGEGDLYLIPELSSWNPNDIVSVCIAYDAALLMKGLTLQYNTLAPHISDNPSLVIAKQQLDKKRDSIYTIQNDDQRLLALYRYELAEREILRDINEKMTKIHWEDIKDNLKEDEACIEFIKYTANAYSWSDGVPTPHYAAILLLGNSYHPIFVDMFDENELHDIYTLQPKSYDTEAGTELFEKLWGKIDGYITGKSRVFFSPMGMLNLINIEALADSSGVTALEKYNLTRVSSTRQIVYSKEETPIQSVVSYGGIDYTEMSEAIVDSFNTRGNWTYLKNTLTEVRNVEASLQKNNIKVTTIIGSEATEASFKALDGTTANVIHIASHGFYVPEPRREAIPYFANSDYTKSIKDELFYSGLVMSGGQSAWIDSTFKAEVDDGILTSYEISKLDLHNVDLVVLSACETGLGDDLFDGIFGLQRAFKKAGVTSILMSLWSINDRATSEYMELFYNFLTSGLSKQESYRRTVSEMRNRYQDANYWASFVLLD